MSFYWTSFTFQQVFCFHWPVMTSYLYQCMYYMLTCNKHIPKWLWTSLIPSKWGSECFIALFLQILCSTSKVVVFLFLCFGYKFIPIWGSFGYFSRWLYCMVMHPLAFQSLARWAGSHDDPETITVEGMGMLLASVLTASEVLSGDNKTEALPWFNAPEVGKIYSSLCFCVSEALACAQERRPLSDIPEAVRQCMEDTLSSPAAVKVIDLGLQTLLMLQSFSWCYKEGDDPIGTKWRR